MASIGEGAKREALKQIQIMGAIEYTDWTIPVFTKQQNEEPEKSKKS